MLVYIDSTIASDLHLHPLHHHQCAKYIGFNWKSLVLWTICVIRNYMPLLYLGFFLSLSLFGFVPREKTANRRESAEPNERAKTIIHRFVIDSLCYILD